MKEVERIASALNLNGDLTTELKVWSVRMAHDQIEKATECFTPERMIEIEEANS